MTEKTTIQKPRKSPGLAGFLAIFPGIGAFYNEQFLKGFVFIFVFAGLVSMQDVGRLQPLPGLLLFGFIVYMIIDAVQNAKRINEMDLQVEKKKQTVEEFPRQMKEGSIFWGIVIIALGIILLMANFQLISYDTVFDLWPAGIIVIGIKLVADYFSKDKEYKKS